MAGNAALNTAFGGQGADQLLVKVTTWAQSKEDCIRRMARALREFRNRGVQPNLVFLENLET